MIDTDFVENDAYYPGDGNPLHWEDDDEKCHYCGHEWVACGSCGNDPKVVCEVCHDRGGGINHSQDCPYKKRVKENLNA